MLTRMWNRTHRLVQIVHFVNVYCGCSYRYYSNKYQYSPEIDYASYGTTVQAPLVSCLTVVAMERRSFAFLTPRGENLSRIKQSDGMVCCTLSLKIYQLWGKMFEFLNRVSGLSRKRLERTLEFLMCHQAVSMGYIEQVESHHDIEDVLRMQFDKNYLCFLPIITFFRRLTVFRFKEDGNCHLRHVKTKNSTNTTIHVL